MQEQSTNLNSRNVVSTNKNDIFTDPAIAQAKNEQERSKDELYKYISKNWKAFASVVAAVLIVTYFINSFQESYLRSMQSNADLLDKIQREYNGSPTQAGFLKLYDDLQEAKKNSKAPESDNALSEAALSEANKAFEESKSRLMQLITVAQDVREPYKTISKLYLGLILRKESSPKALEELAIFNAWQTTGKPESPERFYAELGALTLARTFLDVSTAPEDYLKARNLLLDLAKNSQYVAVSAAKTLLSISQNQEEKAAAEKIISDLKVKYPEQAELLVE